MSVNVNASFGFKNWITLQLVAHQFLIIEKKVTGCYHHLSILSM